MAYDPETVERIRKIMKRKRGYSQRNMFGGVCFMINGHMACGVLEKNLMLRLNNALAQAALTEPHTHEMDFTGKPMKSMLYVDAKGIATDPQLKAWVDRAVAFAKTLPPKVKE
jgi:TfoX/Sxy family transcriptional regulator of competence genes